MADARRCLGGRGHPALLTCVMLVATAVALLQYACNSTGPASSLLLSSLATHTLDAKEHLAHSILGTTDAAPPALEVDTSHFVTVEPETHEAKAYSEGDESTTNGTDLTGGLTMDEEASVISSEIPIIRGETESSQGSVDRDLDDNFHNPEENHENLGPVSPHAITAEILLQIRREASNGSQLVSSPPLPQASPDPKISKPEPIFEELQACKKAIAEASRDTADPSLYRGVYKNVAAFSKSYELMEKIFKVYTYRDGRHPLVHTGPVVGIYASEGQFIERMKRSAAYQTRDPSKAHMFFLPYSVQHMVEHLYVPDSHTMLPLATFIKEYVDTIARRYPFWNRTQGSDHFFVSCHDWGPATARDHPTLRTNAMKVVCNADLTEEFVLGKDGSLPEVYVHKVRKRKAVPGLGGPGWNKRPYLAFFAGQMHGRVRPILLHHWKAKDPEMLIYEVLPKGVASYVEHMRMSRYCICAAGFEVNSPRVVEAIYYDCVPVVIADHFVLPFSEVLDWDTFSVTIPEHEIPRLKEILTAIPEKRYRSMQARLRKVRQHFVWHEKPEKYDVFHMILHSVWSSRLHRLEQVRTSSGELF